MMYIRKTLSGFIPTLRRRLPHFGVLPAATAGLMLVVMLGVTTAQAQVSGISYTVSPIGQRVYWDGAAALDDGYFYGGALGFGFGEYVELSAVYMLGNNFDTNFSELAGDSLMALADLPGRSVDIQRYGGRLRLNLGSGRIVPFATVGTGIMKFSPDGLDATESIYAEGGLGVTFSLANRYTLSLAAQGLGYRYNPSTAFMSDDDLAAAGLTRESLEEQSVFNPAVSAALKFYLGGRSSSELTAVDRALISQFRGGNFRVAVEPFYGQINFNDALGFAGSRAVAGVNAGFDFGPYIGLRAFYWRDTEEAKVFEDGIPSKLGDVSFYGGELDLRFRSQLGGQSFSPYLIVGGGYMDVKEETDFVNAAGMAPESRYFAMGGGGIEVPLTRSVQLQGSIRSVLMSTEDVEDVSAPNSVHNSFMYTAGLNFNIGGSGRTLGTTLEGQMATERANSEARDEAIEVKLARLQARIDSMETARAMMPEAATPATTDRPGAPATTPATTTRTDTSTPAQPMVVAQRDTVFVQTQRGSNLSGKTLTIPVPEEGEIYIRFGPAPAAPAEAPAYAPPMIVSMVPQMLTAPAINPATPASTTTTTTATTTPVHIDTSATGEMTAEQIRQIVRQAMAEQQPGLTTEELNQSLRRLETRIEQRIARESNLMREEQAARPRPAQQGAASASADSMSGGGLLGSLGERRLVAVHPLVGLRLGEGPTQFLVGARGDYRFSRRSFRFLPEATLGIGDKVAINAFGNIAWGLGRVGPLRPYAGTGVGFLSDSGLSGLELAFNLLAGAEYTTLGGGTFFGEYSTLDFFKVNRLLVGYRLQF